MSILDEIVASKFDEVKRAKGRVPAAEMAARAKAISEPSRGFRAALAGHAPPAVIAELKRKSPSKGEIRPGFEPVAGALAYLEGDAACLSVLTDEPFFGGRLDYLLAVRNAVPLPLLRKDFIVDPYQIDESRAAGADAILLIVSSLSDSQLSEFMARAADLALECLVEVHDESELDRALAVGADLVGVNNRDLATFEVDLDTTVRLAAQVPQERDVLLVTESGVRSHGDVEYLAQAGARAFLVGESLMRQPNVSEALRALRGVDAVSLEGVS